MASTHEDGVSLVAGLERDEPEVSAAPSDRHEHVMTAMMGRR